MCLKVKKREEGKSSGKPSKTKKREADDSEDEDFKVFGFYSGAFRFWLSLAVVLIWVLLLLVEGQEETDEEEEEEDWGGEGDREEG